MNKLIFGFVTCITLSGCGMEYDEYKARIEYCESLGLAVDSYSNIDGSVSKVYCLNSNGSRFNSVYDKEEK